MDEITVARSATGIGGPLFSPEDIAGYRFPVDLRVRSRKVTNFARFMIDVALRCALCSALSVSHNGALGNNELTG
jgi:hypothetical protein